MLSKPGLKVLLALSAAALLVLSACSSEDRLESAIERAADEAGADVDLDLGAGGSVSLPDDFPSSFPIPDGAKPVFSSSMDEGFTLWFGGGGDAESFYASALKADGWSIVSEQNIDTPDGETRTIIFSGNGYAGSIVFGAGGAAGGFGGNFDFFVVLTADDS